MVMVKYKKRRSMCRNKRTKGSVQRFGVGEVWDKLQWESRLKGLDSGSSPEWQDDSHFWNSAKCL